MTDHRIDILEIRNTPEALIFRVVFYFPFTIKHDEKTLEISYYAAISGDRFWIRKAELSATPNFNNRLEKDQFIREMNHGGDSQDFIFRIDTSDPRNIEKEIRQLSIYRNINNVLPVSTRSLFCGSETAMSHYGYINRHFTGNPNGLMDQEFNLNLLFLLLINKLIEYSVDDACYSVNCKQKLEILAKPDLGRFLINRMMFFKYSQLFYDEHIRIWENSGFVNSSFIEFYHMLVREDLEKYYEPDYIAFGFTNWFDQPERDLDCFLKFVNDSCFFQ